ncbi:MAG: CPBP family intramembrane metalloprotease [Eubacterium sp.]|nr:CPBP family intramembrane metalloprotease [Eubacterium sp.]
MKKNNFLIVLRVVFAIAAWWVIFKGYTAFVEPLFADSIPETFVLILRSMIVPYTLGLGACYLILRGMDKGEMSGDIAPSPGLVIKGFFIQQGLAMPVIMFVNIICQIFGITKVGMTADELFGKEWLFYLILLLVFNPIFEELLFRKLLLDRLLVLGETPAIVISAILFGLPHIYSMGLPLFFGTCLIGLVWAYVRVHTGKLWPSIVLHSLFNVYGSYFTLAMAGSTPTTMLVALLGFIILPLIAAILLVTSGIFKRADKVEIKKAA